MRSAHWAVDRILATAVAALPVAEVAHAGGFAIVEQSASAADAGIGAVAGLPDASTVFYNAATISRLGNSELQLGLGVAYPRYDYTDGGVPIRAAAQCVVCQTPT